MRGKRAERERDDSRKYDIDVQNIPTAEAGCVSGHGRGVKWVNDEGGRKKLCIIQDFSL